MPRTRMIGKHLPEVTHCLFPLAVRVQRGSEHRQGIRRPWITIAKRLPVTSKKLGVEDRSQFANLGPSCSWNNRHARVCTWESLIPAADKTSFLKDSVLSIDSECGRERASGNRRKNFSDQGQVAFKAAHHFFLGSSGRLELLLNLVVDRHGSGCQADSSRRRANTTDTQYFSISNDSSKLRRDSLSSWD